MKFKQLLIVVLLVGFTFTGKAQEPRVKETPQIAALSGCLMALSVASCITAKTPLECDAAIEVAVQTCGSMNTGIEPLLREASGLKDGDTSSNNDVNRIRSMLIEVRTNLMKLQVSGR